MRKSLVEIGHKYAKLTVARKVRSKFWECLCDCGNLKTICSTSLLSGNTKSCGCYRNESAATRHKNLIGRKFGRLTVLREIDRVHRHLRRFECVCECGQTKLVNYAALATGNTRSCGCLSIEMHKQVSQNAKKKHPLYTTWIQMLSRCEHSSDKNYKNYGGRGIKVCERWQTFENFITDMGARPEGYSIERKDNNGNYEPSNCVWATPVKQVRNRRITLFVKYAGITKPLAEWCDEFNISYKIVHDRIYRYKWSIERALTTLISTPSQ